MPISYDYISKSYTYVYTTMIYVLNLYPINLVTNKVIYLYNVVFPKPKDIELNMFPKEIAPEDKSFNNNHVDQ